MTPLNENNAKKGFTATEQKMLYGLAERVGEKHQCSGTYVRHIIRGKRNTKSNKAQKIVKDLKALLELLRPE